MRNQGLGLFLLLSLAGCGQSPQTGEVPPAAPTRARATAAATQTRTLSAGWSSVAFSFEQLTVLQATGQVTALASWDGTNYVLGPPTTATVNAADGGRRGFWALSSGNATLTFDGQDDSRGSAVNLRNGWNLVTFPAPGNTTQLAIEGPVLPQFTEIQPDNSYRQVDASAPVRTDRAYWVFASGVARLSWTAPPAASPVPGALTVTPAAQSVNRLTTATFKATKDGLDVTAQATWTSSNPGVAAVLEPGAVKALNVGQADITATLNGATARAALTVTDVAGPPVLTSPTPLPSPNLVGLRSTPPQLLLFSDLAPEQPTVVNLTNLAAGDVPVGLDVRPYNNGLYMLTQTGTGQVTLYFVSPRTGLATPVGAVSQGAAAPLGTGFGMDFDPSADRIRVVNELGSNFRLNPNDGTLSNTDSSLPFGSTVAGVAYTNNQPNLSTTTAYLLDSLSDTLGYSPNLIGGSVTTVGPAGVDFTAVNGFDVAPGVNATSSGTPVASGTGFAALQVGTSTSLYSVDLPTGRATLRGPIGSGSEPLAGLACLTRHDYGLGLFNNGNNLLRAYISTFPGLSTQSTVNASAGVATIPNGENLVGLDWRSSTGQLFALGINGATDNGTLYRLDPRAANLTIVGSVGQVAFVDGGGAPIDLPPASAGYGFDYNPVGTPESFRVTTSTGLNFRVNVNGSPVDGDLGGAPVAGTNPDQPLNAPGVGGFVGVDGAAYTNNFGGATATTLYTLDGATDSLYVQNQDPVNNGTQTLVGRLPVDFTNLNGFDILPGVTVSAINGRAGGTAVAVLAVGGVSSIYRIDLSSGATTLISTLTGFTVTGFTLAF